MIKLKLLQSLEVDNSIIENSIIELLKNLISYNGIKFFS